MPTVAEYKNNYLQNAYATLFKQMKRYFTACHNERNFITATENYITQKLLPAMEDKLVDDMMEGGKHEYKYLDNKGHKILMIDTTAFCNYQASQGWGLLERYGCPLQGKYSLIEEGKKMLELIDDFCKLSTKEFVEKHHVPPERHGEDKLARHLYKLFDDKQFEDIGGLRSDFIGGIMRFDDRAVAPVYQYLCANPECFVASMDGNVMSINGKPVHHIGAFYGFGREKLDDTKPIRAQFAELRLYHDAEEKNCSTVRMKAIPLETERELGKHFEKHHFEKFIPRMDTPEMQEKARKAMKYHQARLNQYDDDELAKLAPIPAPTTAPILSPPPAASIVAPISSKPEADPDFDESCVEIETTLAGTSTGGFGLSAEEKEMLEEHGRIKQLSKSDEKKGFFGKLFGKK